jgi:hypothetical protein
MIRRATISLVVLAVTLLTAAQASAVGPGVITGTVSPASIAPEVEVCVVEAQASELCTAPDAGGTYRLTGVPVGAQRVEFVPSHRSGYLKQYYNQARKLEQATVIGISAPPNSEVKGIDAELERGSTIQGTVRASLGKSPLADIEVCAVEIGTGAEGGCSITDASGAYALVGLVEGTYRVGFWGHGSSAKYASGETTIVVPRATSLTGVDAELAVGARIEGTVRQASTGMPLPEISVCLFAVSATAPTQCAFTEAGGGYAILGIAAGDYQVGFALGAEELGGEPAFGGAAGYLSQYYADAATRAGSRTLSLILGQVSSGVDAALLSPRQDAPPAPPGPLTNPSSSLVQVFSEPTKQKPKKAKRCRRSSTGKLSKGRPKCTRKPHRNRKKRRHKQHRASAAAGSSGESPLLPAT